jgi:hypothetical protein
MPAFHGNTIGVGLVLLTPTADGQPDEVMTTDGAGNLALAKVKTAGLADDAVTNAKLADNSVANDQLVTSAVTGSKIAGGSVDTFHLIDDGVTAAKLADTGVAPDVYTAANIVVDAQGRITAAANGLGLGDDNLWTGENAFTQSIEAMAGMNASAGAIHFNDTERAGTGNTPAIDLRVTNHWSVLASTATGNVTVTLTPPLGPTAGSIIVQQGATPRDITWNSTVPIVWLGCQPTWNDPAEAQRVRIVSCRFDGNALYLTATERS